MVDVHCWKYGGERQGLNLDQSRSGYAYAKMSCICLWKAMPWLSQLAAYMNTLRYVSEN